MEMGDFGVVLHSFMDYFDYATILIVARIVDVLDQLNNHGKPLEEYSFWPDVLDGLKVVLFLDTKAGTCPQWSCAEFTM